MQRQCNTKNWRSIVFLVLIMGITLSLLLQINVFAAATGTHTPVTGVTVEVSGATDNSMSNGAVTVTAKGSGGVFGIGASAKTATIEITNAGGSTANVSFDWTATSVNQLMIDGTVVSGSSGTFTKLLKSEESVTITITTAKNNTTNKLVMNNFSWTVAAESSNVTFNFDSSLGSVTLGGSSISSGTTHEVSLSKGIALVATPRSGVTFLGWIDEADGSLLSSDASCTLAVAKDSTVRAAFASANSSAWFLVGGKYFNDLSTAVTKGSLVTLAANGTLPAGNYTIPSGVTLLIPYDSANTLCTTTATTTTSGTTLINLTTPAWVKPTVYRKLTMESGTNIVVNGAISLSGAQCSTQRSNGMPTGATSMIDMKAGSSITVNSGAKLYAWGYIVGSGTVLIKSGGTVYEDFQIRDWRGGTAVSAMLNQSQKVFPVSQYYVQNIEVAMTLEAGASEYGYMSLVASKVFADATIPFIGSEGMFRLTSGSLTKDYIEAEDRLSVTIDGDLSMSSLVIDVSSYNMDSSKYVLPISNNLVVTVNQGTTTISQDMAFLPGSELFIAEGATVKIASGVSLYVYDLDEWKDKNYVYSACDVSPLEYVGCNAGKPNNRPTMADAKITINGTLDVSAGYLYTTLGGANICSTDNGKIICGSAGTQTITYQATQSGSDISWSDIGIEPAKLHNLNDSYIVSGSGTYVYVDGFWRCEDHGDNYTNVVTQEPTCYQEGVRTYTCSVCAHSYTETIAATGAHVDADTDGHCDTAGCTYEFKYCAHENTTVLPGVDATCTTSGLTEGLQCNDCDLILTPQTEISALGHSYKSEITTQPTCEGEGVETHICEVCGYSYTSAVAAKGHSYDEGAVTDSPTCTVFGKMTYTCEVCGDQYTSGIKPLGHDMVSDAAVAPTCTDTGLTEGSHCSRCKDATTAQEVVPALGHDMVTDAAVAPDCTNTGLTEGKHCSRCDGATTAQEVVPALGHDMVTDAAVAPDCTNTGLTEGKHCSRCDGATTAQEVVAALGHSYNSVVTAPTCTAEGYTTHTCSVCGDSYKDTYVDAKGHTEVIDAAVDPTCTDTGLTEGKHCSVCGTVTVAQTVVAALGHSYDSVVTAPTCTDKGYTTYTCSVCGDSYVADEVAALGHSYDAAVTAPTCTDKGYTTYTCSVCGDSYVSDDVASLGHSYDAVVTAPTFDAQGYTTHTCSNCGDSYVDSYVPALIAVAKIGEQRYQTLAEAFAAAGEGTTIVLLAHANYTVDATGVTVDLNGYTWTGTYIGTLKMNGGTLITAEGYKMAGPEADYYKTEDAVFTMSPIVGSTLVDVTVHSGTMTIVPDEWWTGKGQTITIESGAKLVIPAGKTMQVLSTVVVEGTVTVEGTVNLYDKDATIAGPEGLNVVTSAGDTVLYVDGTYKVHDHAHAFNREIAPVDGVGGNVYRCDCSDEYTVETYVITFIANDATVSQQILEKGSMPEIPADPTKAADAQYTYTFKGWDAEVALATAPATYAAVFDATVNTYTITFVDFFGNSTSATLEYGKNIAFPEPITETMYLNVTFLGWKQGDEIVSGAQSVVGDATYVSSYRVDSIKFGAVWMSVSVDANINATIFVQVDHGVDFEGEGFTEITLDGAANKLYMRAVSISAEDINNNAFGIGVTYKTLHGDISKQFSSLILTYMEALDGAPGAEDNEFSKELVTSILAYGSAVRQYFHNEFNEEWADLTVTSSELQTYYNNYNIQVSATGDLSGSNKKYVDLRSANVQFQTDYTMRYYFKLNDVDFTKITGYGVIVTDGNGYEKTYDFQGKPVRDPKDVSRYMVLYEVDAGDITKDMYVTVYVTTETETYHSDTMQYSLYKYLIRQLYMYSLTPEQGGKRVTGDTDGQKTAQYVAMLNSLLQLGKAYNEYTANISN